MNTATGARHRMHFRYPFSDGSADRYGSPVTKRTGRSRRSGPDGAAAIGTSSSLTKAPGPDSDLAAAGGALVQRAGRDRARPGELLEDGVGVLVGEDERRRDVVVWPRQPLQEPIDRLGCMGTVAYLTVPWQLEPPRRARPPPEQRYPEVGLGRQCGVADLTSWPATSSTNSSSGGATTAPSCATAASRRRSAPRSGRTRRCARPDVRPAAPTPASTTFVASSRPPTPAWTTATSTPRSAK